MPLKKSFFIVLILISAGVNAQYKEYKINPKGDTINAVNQSGQKVGKWVVEIGEIRGEPGYVEEGVFKKGVKDGYWRRYSTEGDLIALEQYILGGKDGIQKYYTFTGQLEREESWRGYNPDAPYDTIAIYGTGSGEIVDYKIVKAEPYSVKQGVWRYFDPGTGQLLRTENWERNNLVNPNAPKTPVTTTENSKPKKPEKPKEMQEWELKNKGKKKVLREGGTGL